MSETGRDDSGALGLTLIVFGVLGMIVVLVSTGLTASHGGVGYLCSTEGPYADLASRAGEADAFGRFSVWPLGRTCDWARDGHIYASADSDWTATIAFLFCAASAVVGRTLLDMLAKRSRSEMTDAASKR
jgi:hypothetical protein